MSQNPLDYATPSPRAPRRWLGIVGLIQILAVLFIAVSGTRFVYWGFHTLRAIDLTYGSHGEVDRCLDACVAMITPLALSCGLFLFCQWYARQ